MIEQGKHYTAEEARLLSEYGYQFVAVHFIADRDPVYVWTGRFTPPEAADDRHMFQQLIPFKENP